uniref:Uncharacterized protein n=1 Tax=Tetranychus urticae TaxID=32264 RepID=T1JTM5_TETUR
MFFSSPKEEGGDYPVTWRGGDYYYHQIRGVCVSILDNFMERRVHNVQTRNWKPRNEFKFSAQ